MLTEMHIKSKKQKKRFLHAYMKELEYYDSLNTEFKTKRKIVVNTDRRKKVRYIDEDNNITGITKCVWYYEIFYKPCDFIRSKQINDFYRRKCEEG